jgi:hypothetical protein
MQFRCTPNYINHPASLASESHIEEKNMSIRHPGSRNFLTPPQTSSSKWVLKPLRLEAVLKGHISNVRKITQRDGTVGSQRNTYATFKSFCLCADSERLQRLSRMAIAELTVERKQPPAIDEAAVQRQPDLPNRYAIESLSQRLRLHILKLTFCRPVREEAD